MNSHGGNSDVLAVAARDIHQNTGMLVFAVDIMRLLADTHPRASSRERLTFTPVISKRQ